MWKNSHIGNIQEDKQNVSWLVLLNILGSGWECFVLESSQSSTSNSGVGFYFYCPFLGCSYLNIHLAARVNYPTTPLFVLTHTAWFLSAEI